MPTPKPHQRGKRQSILPLLSALADLTSATKSADPSGTIARLTEEIADGIAIYPQEPNAELTERQAIAHSNRVENTVFAALCALTDESNSVELHMLAEAVGESFGRGFKRAMSEEAGNVSK